MRLALFLGLTTGCGGSELPHATAPTTPTVDAVAISPAQPTAGAPLLCSAEVEGTPAMLAFEWSVDGTPAAQGASLPAGSTVAGEEWTCTVTPRNEDRTGRPVSASVEIVDGSTGVDTGVDPGVDTGEPVENTPPGAPGISVQPGTPGVGEPIACVVDQASEDVDGDTVWYRFSWTHNDAETELTSGVVPPDQVGLGDRWTCTVTPTDGIEEGEPASATAEVGGCDGGSLAFTGEDHVRTDGSTPLSLGDGDWTIEAYVKRDAAATDDPMMVASHHDDGAGGWWLGVAEMGPNRSLVLRLDDGATSQDFVGAPVEAGRWIHVAAVRLDGDVTLYVDGRPADPDASLSPAAVDGPLYLGTLLPSGTVDEALDGGWHGLLDQLHLSTVARYSGTFSPDLQLVPDPDSLLFWELREGGGTTTTDGATGAYPGTLEGPTWTADSPCLGG